MLPRVYRIEAFDIIYQNIEHQNFDISKHRSSDKHRNIERAFAVDGHCVQALGVRSATRRDCAQALPGAGRYRVNYCLGPALGPCQVTATAELCGNSAVLCRARLWQAFFTALYWAPALKCAALTRDHYCKTFSEIQRQ